MGPPARTGLHVRRTNRAGRSASEEIGAGVSGMAQLNCIVVTPEKTAVEAATDFVVVPLSDGELGIAPGHSPLIGRLGYGELRLGHGEKAERYYVDGGFV